MIGSFEPCGHRTPRPRIDLNKPRPPRADTSPIEGMSIHEKNRIWQLVVIAAEGSNIAGGAREPEVVISQPDGWVILSPADQALHRIGAGE